MLENNHYAVTVNHDANGEIAVFKFMTYEGKELVVNGALATNVCDFMNYDYLDKGSNLAKAWMYHKAETLEVDWKSLYNVKDAKAFYVKYLGIDKTTFEKYALAASRLMEDDENGKPKFKLACLEGISVGKLVILNKYFAETLKTCNDEATANDMALATIEADFAKGIINLFMTDKKFDEAIKKSFNTIEVEAKEVETPKQTETETPKQTETETPKQTETETPKQTDNTPSKADKEGPTLKSMYDKLRAAMDVVEDKKTNERTKYKALLEAVKYSLDMLS